MSSEALVGPRRRLHPAEVVFAAGDAVKDLLLPIVVGVVVGAGAGSGRGLLLAVGGALLGVVLALARWRTTSYTLTDRDVRFRSGVVSPDEVVVPISRIGSVDLVEGPVQRLFGVVELQVHVAGGGDDPEIRLRAVSRHEARRLQRALGHPGSAVAAPVFRLSSRRLLVGALTGPQLGLVVSVVGAAGAVLGPALQSGGGERFAERLVRSPGTLLLLAMGVLAASAVLAVLGSVVAFAGFEVRVEGGRLRIRRGLLQRHAASVPLERIHAVLVSESPLRQPFGLVTLYVETASARDRSAAVRTLVPVATRDEAAALLRRILPELAWAAGPLERPPARARRRYALRPALAGIALGAALTVVLHGAWPAIGVLAAAGLGLGLQRHADAGWAVDEQRVTFRARRIARRTLVARRRRLQGQGLRQTVLQRRGRLAGFDVVVGSGAKGGVDQLDEDVAARLYAALRPAAR